MRKIIGIVCREEKDNNNYDYYGINKELVSLVRSYDCIVLPIMVDFFKDSISELERVKIIIDNCNGIILQGGSNFYDIDILIVKYLYHKNIPTLGICLGMQIMGKAFNGQVKQLIDDFHYKKSGYVHIVEIEDNSKLFEIINTKRMMVNSRHYDYVMNTQLDVVAYSEDGVIEALEAKNKLFFIGVQWHPESNIDNPYNKKLFDYYFSIL